VIAGSMPMPRSLAASAARTDSCGYARAIADAERLRNDPNDQAELAAIAQEMDEIRAW